MPVDTRDIIDLVATLSENQNLQVTVKESLKGGLIAGGAAIVGGILGGPIGLAVGAIIGGCTAAYLSRNKFKSAVIVIREMNRYQQEKLANLVNNIVNKLDATDAVTLVSLVTGNPLLQKEIVECVIGYLRNEMKLEIKD